MNKLAIAIKAFKSVVSSNGNNQNRQNEECISVSDVFHFTALEPDCIITLKKNSSKAPDVDLEYSINGGEWLLYSVGTPITLADSGDIAYLRAADSKRNSTFCDEDRDGYHYFTATKKVNISGNIMSLVSRNKISTTLVDRYNDNMFNSLFENMATLIDASQLQMPAMVLTSSCYEYMFCNCINLIKAPNLPADTMNMGCYTGMFQGCSNLTEAPKLPAMKLDDYCYMNMFQDCINLSKAPDLPASTLCEACYSSMFSNCQKLQGISLINAIELAEHCCDSMFFDCKSLTSVPTLMATVLPEKCYDSMFCGCASLSNVSINATDASAFMCLSDWLLRAGTNASSKSLQINADVYRNKDCGDFKTTYDCISDNSLDWNISPII